MIINDFLNLKDTCPFCNEGLRTFLISPGFCLKSKFENDILSIESRYVKTSINILNNEIVATERVNFGFSLRRDCVIHNEQFQNNGCAFEHEISYDISSNTKFLILGGHIEKIQFNKYSLIFSPTTKSLFGTNGVTNFNIPYFNPNSLTIEQIKNKVSTYLIFS